MKRTKPSRSHLVIPDCQVKPGVNTDHLAWAGEYIADRRPDVVVCLGDFWDMPSLSSYDKGKRSFEGRRYKADIEAGKAGMERLMAPWRRSKNIRKIFIVGNHEQRIERATDDDSKLDGTIGYSDFGLERAGWDVVPFLRTRTVDGITYSHFFPRASSGAVTQTKNGAPNARAQLIREGRSCTAGHRQGLDVACAPLGGKLAWGIIAGSFYSHQESYLSPQGEEHWRGLVLKMGVANGTFSPIFVSLDYLSQRYGK